MMVSIGHQYIISIYRLTLVTCWQYVYHSRSTYIFICRFKYKSIRKFEFEFRGWVFLSFCRATVHTCRGIERIWTTNDDDARIHLVKQALLTLCVWNSLMIDGFIFHKCVNTKIFRCPDAFMKAHTLHIIRNYVNGIARYYSISIIAE